MRKSAVIARLTHGFAAKRFKPGRAGDGRQHAAEHGEGEHDAEPVERGGPRRARPRRRRVLREIGHGDRHHREDARRQQRQRAHRHRQPEERRPRVGAGAEGRTVGGRGSGIGDRGSEVGGRRRRRSEAARDRAPEARSWKLAADALDATRLDPDPRSPILRSPTSPAPPASTVFGGRHRRFVQAWKPIVDAQRRAGARRAAARRTGQREREGAVVGLGLDLEVGIERGGRLRAADGAVSREERRPGQRDRRRHRPARALRHRIDVPFLFGHAR